MGERYDIVPLVLEHARRAAQIIDEACEKSLFTSSGVTVTLYPDGRVTAEVDPNVPYGTIEERRL